MMSVRACKARKDSFEKVLRKCNIWQSTDTTYELDECTSKCDAPALSSPSATPIYPLLWERAMDAPPSCFLLQWEWITSPKHPRCSATYSSSAERPCLPFSPGVLCSHCLTEWLIWPNFMLQASIVQCLCAREHPGKYGSPALLGHCVFGRLRLQSAVLDLMGSNV